MARINDDVLIGVVGGIGIALMFEGITKTRPDTTILHPSGKIIKPVYNDNFGRPSLKFILGDTPEYVLVDSGNPTNHISPTKSTADRIGITKYPKYKDGYIIPVNLPGVGHIPAMKVFIEDRGAICYIGSSSNYRICSRNNDWTCKRIVREDELAGKIHHKV